MKKCIYEKPSINIEEIDMTDIILTSFKDEGEDNIFNWEDFWN